MGSEGIYTCSMTLETGALELRHVTGEIENPSFLAADPTGDHLYAVCEVGDDGGNGAVTAYAIASDGSLRALNRQSTGGPGPCHLAVDASDTFVIAANYRGGSVAMIPIEADGSLGERCDFIQHEGTSINPDRQDQAHAHSVTINDTNDRAYICDLGMDQIVVYDIDHGAKRLRRAADLTVIVQAGQGPRHFAFHPTNAYAYAINELGSTVAVYDLEVASGRLTEKQLISTLPSAWEGENTTADIHVSSDGRFLYGSNRGHDSIAIFAIDPATGQLDAIGNEPTRGENPRNFALAPDGRYLLAENQDSGTIVTFAVNEQTGELSYSGNQIDIPAPVCVVFRP
jgi:6-phosphogluconolactonase